MERCFEINKEFEIDNPFREEKKIKVKLYGNKISIVPVNSQRISVKVKLIKEEIESCQTCKFFTCCTAVKLDFNTTETLPRIISEIYNKNEIEKMFYLVLKNNETTKNYMLCKYEKRMAMEKLVENLEESIKLEKEMIATKEKILQQTMKAFLEGKLIKIGGGRNDIASGGNTDGNEGNNT